MGFMAETFLDDLSLQGLQPHVDISHYSRLSMLGCFDSAILGAIPQENKTIGCDTPLCDTISKMYCAIWGGISRTRQ